MSEDIYVKLAERLNTGHAGAPMSESLIGILKVLWTPEEAEVGLHLALYENRTIEQLASELPRIAEEIPSLLASMARKGTVFTEQKPGNDRIFRLLPSVVGFAEAPYLSGEDTEDKRKMAPLWRQYLVEEFAEEMARGVPLIRVIPISESLEDSSEVLPFDAIKEKLAGMRFMAVGHCPCRQIGTYNDEGCGRPTERCMHFGSLGRHFVEQGMARRIDLDEALEILSKATDEGLVHVCDNVEGSLRTICNCCPCCCGFFRASAQAGLQTYSRSNYVAVVEPDSCTGCATCEERCPVKAITVQADIAVVDADRCIGCGVCEPTCGGDSAIKLTVREEVSPPPDFQKFLEARLNR